MLAETRALAHALAERGLDGAPVYFYAGPDAPQEQVYGVVAVELVVPAYDLPSGRPYAAWDAEFTLTVHAQADTACEAAVSACVGLMPPNLVLDGADATDVLITELTGIEYNEPVGVWVCDIAVRLRCGRR